MRIRNRLLTVAGVAAGAPAPAGHNPTQRSETETYTFVPREITLRTLARALTVSGSLAAAVALGGLAATPALAATTLSSGHVDVLDADWDGSALSLHVHDEETDTEYDPADVTLSVPAAAKVANPGYGFLGTGSQVWLLPDTEAEADAAGVLFPGISTEHLTTGVFANNNVTYRLLSATRNGAATEDFSIYAGSGSRWFDSDTSTTSFKSRTFAVGTHNHANWAFEEAGTYQLTFRVQGTVSGVTQSDTAVYTVVVS
ncbi:choice-of-anchor M domain-containing protein [Streptomyces himalayensis]|uniref:TIGR03769 domain-containing protein n=1 Tax=Streptomyces himalayensis subsp. himalayensis TaxID=2756131 RepID=A0A7W0DNI5_9ACTN|nr:choice-of-anchor M domain-containing protein [Streptomyces himalayensis]MBA2947619.1 TIGR03769 domain-containing protein [Streptomyces himalayensis subsp. himalayensis]